MKKQISTYLALSTLFAGSLFADSPATTGQKKAAPVPDYPVVPSLPCPNDWRVSGSYLYLLPTVDDTYFVIKSPTSTTFPNGKRKNNDFSFHSAFRVGAEYAMCDHKRELQAFYTYLSADQHRKVEGDFLWAIFGNPDFADSFENYDGSASSKLHLLYQRLDVNFSQEALNCYGVHFYFQPGLEYAYIRLKEHYEYETASTEGNLHQKARLWGIGPQLGIGVEYNMYEGHYSDTVRHVLSVTGLFSGSLLASYNKNNQFSELDDTTALDVSSRRTWRTIPALHARAGFNYLVQCSNMGFNVGVGYEISTYIRAQARMYFADDVADSLSFSDYYNFDVQGLSVNASLSF